MSADENTRLAQSAYEAFGRGDMAALAQMMADDIEWVNPGDPAVDPNAGTFKGKDAVLGWFCGLASTVEFTTLSRESSSPRTTRWCLWCMPRQPLGTRAGLFVNHAAHVWTFRDGKVARLQIYLDTAATAAAHRVE